MHLSFLDLRFPFPYIHLYIYPLIDLGSIMEPMDIVAKAKEDASLPKGFYFIFFIIINY